MARLRLLADYNNLPAGEVVELPGGVASVLILRGIAEFDPAPVEVPSSDDSDGSGNTHPETVETGAATIVVPAEGKEAPAQDGAGATPEGPQADSPNEGEDAAQPDSPEGQAAKEPEAAPVPPEKPTTPPKPKAPPRTAKPKAPTKPKPAAPKAAKPKRK